MTTSRVQLRGEAVAWQQVAIGERDADYVQVGRDGAWLILQRLVAGKLAGPLLRVAAADVVEPIDPGKPPQPQAAEPAAALVIEPGSALELLLRFLRRTPCDADVALPVTAGEPRLRHASSGSIADPTETASSEARPPQDGDMPWLEHVGTPAAVATNDPEAPQLTAAAQAPRAETPREIRSEVSAATPRTLQRLPDDAVEPPAGIERPGATTDVTAHGGQRPTQDAWGRSPSPSSETPVATSVALTPSQPSIATIDAPSDAADEPPVIGRVPARQILPIPMTAPSVEPVAARAASAVTSPSAAAPAVTTIPDLPTTSSAQAHPFSGSPAHPPGTAPDAPRAAPTSVTPPQHQEPARGRIAIARRGADRGGVPTVPAPGSTESPAMAQRLDAELREPAPVHHATIVPPSSAARPALGRSVSQRSPGTLAEAAGSAPSEVTGTAVQPPPRVVAARRGIADLPAGPLQPPAPAPDAAMSRTAARAAPGSAAHAARAAQPAATLRTSSPTAPLTTTAADRRPAAAHSATSPETAVIAAAAPTAPIAAPARTAAAAPTATAAPIAAPTTTAATPVAVAAPTGTAAPIAAQAKTSAVATAAAPARTAAVAATAAGPAKAHVPPDPAASIAPPPAAIAVTAATTATPARATLAATARTAVPRPLPVATMIGRSAAHASDPPIPPTPPPEPAREPGREIRVGDIFVELGDPLPAPQAVQHAGSLLAAALPRPMFHPGRRR